MRDCQLKVERAKIAGGNPFGNFIFHWPKGREKREKQRNLCAHIGTGDEVGNIPKTIGCALGKCKMLCVVYVPAGVNNSFPDGAAIRTEVSKILTEIKKTRNSIEKWSRGWLNL